MKKKKKMGVNNFEGFRKTYIEGFFLTNKR